MENNPEIALAWQFIENTGTHLFLTGKAGTGKTQKVSPFHIYWLEPAAEADI